jgi:hypothetical protein
VHRNGFQWQINKKTQWQHIFSAIDATLDRHMLLIRYYYMLLSLAKDMMQTGAVVADDGAANEGNHLAESITRSQLILVRQLGAMAVQ